jgi:hypothetical protein
VYNTLYNAEFRSTLHPDFIFFKRIIRVFRILSKCTRRTQLQYITYFILCHPFTLPEINVLQSTDLQQCFFFSETFYYVHFNHRTPLNSHARFGIKSRSADYKYVSLSVAAQNTCYVYFGGFMDIIICLQ